MRLLTSVCVLLVGMFALAEARGGCLAGGCSCPDGTHRYSVGCGTVVTQATCEDPIPKPTEGIICDLTRCDCNEPTVMDTESKKCVLIEDCPNALETKPCPEEDADTNEPDDYETQEANE